MMRNTTFDNRLACLAIQCAASGALLVGGLTLDNWVFLGFVCSAAGYFGYKSYNLYKLLIQHSRLQNRAVTLLQKHASEAQQLTSED